MKEWVLIANKSQANVYELDNKKHLKLINTIENQKARLMEKDLVSDFPGIVVNSITGKGGRSLGKNNKALKQTIKVFSQDISSFVKKSHSNNLFDQLYIFAGPSFIGELSSELEKEKVVIKKKITKDLSHLKKHQLEEVIEQNIF